MSSYRIERLIGIGGEAVVYEARPSLPGGDGLPVACKLMREKPRADAEARARMRQEGDLGLRVTPGHPNLVRVLDCFEDVAEGPCIVMELVDGGSLQALLGPGRLPFPITRRIACEVLQALAYLHGQDVLHRDLSPCNILISTSGAVKIADLGIARVMEGGRTYTMNYRGKLVYDSPEGIQTLPLDARSDLYTLGAVLYDALAGTPPCGKDDSLPSIVERQLHEDFAPLPPETPADLAALAMGLLRMDRDAREAQTATGALALLRRHDQPVASAAELAALVMTRKAKRAGEPDGAHRAPDLAPGEMLEPGDVLVARTAGEPSETMPGAGSAQLPAPEQAVPEQAMPEQAVPEQAAPEQVEAEPPPAEQLPVFPLPAEPPLPPLPQPRPRVTTTHAGASEPVRRPPPEPVHVASPSRLRRRAVHRAAAGTLLVVCVLVSGIWLGVRLRGERDGGDPLQRPEVPVPVVVPTPAPSVPSTPERPEVVETDPTPRPRHGHDERVDDSRRPRIETRERPRSPGPGELRWEQLPRRSEPSAWAIP